jgi:hypothetical protein
MTHFADLLPEQFEKLSYLEQLKSVKELLRWYDNPKEEETKKAAQLDEIKKGFHLDESDFTWNDNPLEKKAKKYVD